MEPASVFLAYREGLDKELFHLLYENREIINGISGIVLVPENFPEINQYIDLLKKSISSGLDEYRKITLKRSEELLQKAKEKNVLPLALAKLEGQQSGRIDKLSINVYSLFQGEWGSKYRGTEIETAADNLYNMSADFSKLLDSWNVGNVHASSIGLKDWGYFPTKEESARAIENCMPVLGGYLKNGYTVDYLSIPIKRHYVASGELGDPEILLTLDPDIQSRISGTRPNYPYLKLKNINLESLPEPIRNFADKGLENRGGVIVPSHEPSFLFDSRIDPGGETHLVGWLPPLPKHVKDSANSNE